MKLESEEILWFSNYNKKNEKLLKLAILLNHGNIKKFSRSFHQFVYCIFSDQTKMKLLHLISLGNFVGLSVQTPTAQTPKCTQSLPYPDDLNTKWDKVPNKNVYFRQIIRKNDEPYTSTWYGKVKHQDADALCKTLSPHAKLATFKDQEEFDFVLSQTAEDMGDYEKYWKVWVNVSYHGPKLAPPYADHYDLRQVNQTQHWSFGNGDKIDPSWWLSDEHARELGFPPLGWTYKVSPIYGRKFEGCLINCQVRCGYSGWDKRNWYYHSGITNDCERKNWPLCEIRIDSDENETFCSK